MKLLYKLCAIVYQCFFRYSNEASKEIFYSWKRNHKLVKKLFVAVVHPIGQNINEVRAVVLSHKWKRFAGCRTKKWCDLFVSTLRVFFMGMVICSFLVILSYGEESSGNVTNREFRRPVPYLPNQWDPTSAIDIVSSSACSQVHRSLMRIDDDGIPVPSAAESFSVSQDGLWYTFYLRNHTFHDGTPFRANHVRDSLERSIRIGAPSAQQLHALKGYKKFVDGAAKRVAGIRIIDEKTIQLQVVVRDTNLIYALSRLSLSILSDSNQPWNGLGPFRLTRETQSDVVLSRESTNKDGCLPDSIHYLKTTVEDAISGFREGLFDEIGFFFLDETDAARLGKETGANLISLPNRTHAFVVNPRSIQNPADRRNILQSIDAMKMIRACFPSRQLTESLIPPGLIGYEQAMGKVKSNKDLLLGMKRLRIGLLPDVGQPECVRQEFIRQFATIPELKITTLGLPDFISGFMGNDIDFALVYFETSPDSDLFDFFGSRVTPSFGSGQDEEYDDLVTTFSSETDPLKRVMMASKINGKISAMEVVLPLFHSATPLLFSDRYTLQGVSLRSISILLMDAFRKNTKRCRQGVEK